MEREYTRKGFFAAGLLWAGDRLESAWRRVQPPKIPFLRPPGAAPEAEFFRLCTRCDDCIRACPHFVIRKAGPELGRALAGLPLVLPHENPCLMCDGFPCIESCPTGALDARFGHGIGTAIVDAERCYMAQDQPCDYCADRCPEQPKAIDAATRGEAARVDPARCTGCGICAQICPAQAIAIVDPKR